MLGPKWRTVIVFLKELLNMQFTYPTAWHESWVMARGIQQWNNFRLFHSGEAGNGGINSKRGSHYTSSPVIPTERKHLFTTNPPKSLAMNHKTTKSWVTDPSVYTETMSFYLKLLKNYFIKTNCPLQLIFLFLQLWHVFFFNQQQNKLVNKHLACCLKESFEDSQHKARGHVRTPTQQWHLQQKM